MITRTLKDLEESLNVTKNGLGVDDDTLELWVADVQKWAEDSNKRCHRIRKVILDEKKRLVAAVDDYNNLAEPSRQIMSSDALIETDLWPWQTTSELAADLKTKREVFEKVMAVRRLKEEEMILCREMHRHWTALKARALELGMISSDSSLVGMSEDAKKGLHCLLLKKQTELKAEMVKVKDYYQRILSHQPLLETDEEEEENSDDAAERGSIDREEDAGGSIDREEDAGGSIDREEDAGGSGDREEDAGGSIDREEDAGGSIDREEDAGGSIDREEDAGGSIDREEDAGGSGDREEDVGGSIDREEDAGGSIDREEDAGGSIDREEDAGGSIDREEDAGGSIDREEDAGGSIDREEDAGGSGDREEDAGGSGDREEDAGG
ncbi:hypothetical protein D5F01_LYC19140 [Larimichthys crocea]|uniref:Uncharacterized protein n=1 Tax=Larimichthys crocea TaxID=215358 RepID=A0A6G0HRP7_LARCR|nr:hypothetical protein D5F01_LYC19140 [Larimichthys crocea]